MRGGGSGNAVKYGTLAAVFGLFFSTGCGIEKEINSATSKCESIVSEALEGLEATCLTKEEILELLAALQVRNYDADTNRCKEDTAE